MKKESVLFGILIFIFLASLFFVASQEDVTCDEDCKVDKAYSCIEEKAKDCSKLSTEEKIFSLWATGKCKDELLADSNNNECWPKESCEIKTTAQAILALKNIGTSTTESESWLLSKNQSTLDLIWYLQIDSAEETTCTISYSGASYTVEIGTDKKISSNAGNCLGLAQDGYWLRVSSACYDKEFSISCDKSFVTSLLYQTQNSPIYVSETTNSASAGGTLTEKINSFCFGKEDCDYEGSLWAALALDSSGQDVSAFLPYLITMADTNEKNLPEAFLYMLTGEFRSELLAKQKNVNDNYYWDESGNKFYDTALALYPFQYETPEQKIKSKEWLLKEGVQGEDGCWNNGNLRDTAFILYSVWGSRAISSEELIDCEEAGYYCISSMSCEEVNGDVLQDYGCAGIYVCCTENLKQKTCFEQGGEICSFEEVCDGSMIEASDLESGEICCVGTCKVESKPEVSDCELAGGICRINKCYEDEKESSELCEFKSDVCCIKTITGAEPRKKNYTGIIIFIILIILVVLGIIFKDKLRAFWFKLKSQFGKGKSKPGPKPGGPPGPFSPMPSLQRQRTPTPRRILPSQRRPPVRRPRKPKELDEVLKKLKEMGK
ncbi:hypothetical protein DRN69_02850 [Candidatus Pacearchaeota archaeon]|nr:MAG: hypothetical protein DRN69_02850 [Candidatus Pacearchaeota archaeon]